MSSAVNAGISGKNKPLLENIQQWSKVLCAAEENILEHLNPVLQALNEVKVIDNEPSKNHQTRSSGKVVNKNKKR